MNKPIYMDRGEFRKEHKDIVGLLNKTSSVLKQEANAQSKEARMRLGKGVKTRAGRVVPRSANVMGTGLFDVLSGKTTLDFDKLRDKVNTDVNRLRTGKGFDDVLNHYRKVQEAKEAEKAKEYAERKSRIENADKDFSAMVAKYGLKGNVGNGIFGDLFEDAVVEGGKKLYKFDKEHGSHLKEGVKSGFKNMISNVFKGNGIESATRFGRGYMGMGILDDLAKKQFKQPENRFHVLPDVYEPSPSNPFSNWVEKERRDTGYYGRPAILGEGM